MGGRSTTIHRDSPRFTAIHRDSPRFTAIHHDWLGAWRERLDCPPDLVCLAVYLCQDWAPACVAGHCTLQGSEITAD